MKKPMTPSARPCDVAYRLKRYNELLAQAAEFFYAIEPAAMANHGEVELTLRAARNAAVLLQAPAKKTAKKASEAPTPVATADGIPYTEEVEEEDLSVAAE